MPYNLLVCGSNGLYQLGLGNDDDHCELQLVDLPFVAHEKPKAFAFGASHTLVLFPNGKVFASGSNEFGQCGIAGAKILQTFCEIPGTWTDIAAGWEFSILKSNEGHFYSCGHGPKGELGLGEGVRVATEPTKIEFGSKLGSGVCKIQASMSHVVVQLHNGSLLGWGTCRKGQLGNVPTVLNSQGKPKPPMGLWEPTVLSYAPVIDCKVGRERTLLIREEGATTITECNDEDIATPMNGLLISPATSGIKFQCGWSSAHVLAYSQLYGFGKNLHGQVFQHDQFTGDVEDFEVGSEHGVLLAKDNTVYAWGWGEHGNCGPNHDDFKISKLYEGGNNKVVAMACGLATTWIITENQS
ncbi:hypothetical protein PUMCH_003501 [Australozyma saopauloensis]|uniref:Uncharacterized protein n=1 Tax=Australozyma saopauloensis TaxID=291208 RepID=A0AAX4HC47_9ASCO|nr:hypothetical protein PUMCH_003501 [[Candida] saopauloensis]